MLCYFLKCDVMSLSYSSETYAEWKLWKESYLEFRRVKKQTTSFSDDTWKFLYLLYEFHMTSHHGNNSYISK